VRRPAGEFSSSVEQAPVSARLARASVRRRLTLKVRHDHARDVGSGWSGAHPQPDARSPRVVRGRPRERFGSHLRAAVERGRRLTLWDGAAVALGEVEPPQPVAW